MMFRATVKRHSSRLEKRFQGLLKNEAFYSRLSNSKKLILKVPFIEFCASAANSRSWKNPAGPGWELMYPWWCEGGWWCDTPPPWLMTELEYILELLPILAIEVGEVEGQVLDAELQLLDWLSPLRELPTKPPWPKDWLRPVKPKIFNVWKVKSIIVF